MERKEAFGILGLDENADIGQIRTRYENLTRRIRNGEDLDSDNINAAFDLLTGRDEYTRDEGRFMTFYRKFIFHYKGWVILTVIVVALLASLIVPMATKRVPDLVVSFAGRYGTSDLDTLDEYLQQRMPETEDILVEVMYLDEEGESGEFDSGGRTRLTALLLTDEADILVMDDSTYNYVRSDDALMILDDILDEFEVTIESERYIYGIDFKTGEKRIFGIIMDDSRLFADAMYGEEIRIMGIAERTKHFEAVTKAFEILLKDGSE